MSLSSDVDLEEYVMAKDDLSGADIKAVCTEAGLLALRERRMHVIKADFTTAREKASFVNTCSKYMLTYECRSCIGRMRARQRVSICDHRAFSCTLPSMPRFGRIEVIYVYIHLSLFFLPMPFRAS